MKDAICYYYGFKHIDIEDSKRIVMFNSSNNKYALVPSERSIKDVKEIIRISEELNGLGFNCHRIVINKNGNVISPINNCNYVLLALVGDLSKTIDIFDLVANNNRYILNYNYYLKYSSNWAELWKRKVDYLETQIKVFGNANIGVIENFSYYVGLAENAIIYYQNLNYNNNEPLTLSHRRVFFPNYWLNYGNPLSFVFDIPERDYAEYLKSVFFYESIESGYENFHILLKIKKMNRNSLELLLSRLLFPSYYFDVFEEIIFNKSDNKNLITIVEKARDYEQFLKYCYNTIKNKMDINMFPSWIL